MLRDAREEVSRLGRSSRNGKDAKQRIAAATSELQKRGIAIPPDGQELAGCEPEEPTSEATTEVDQK